MALSLIPVGDHACGKLYGIGAVDFGFAGGITCRWKTPFCSAACYGKHGRYDPRVLVSYRPIARRLRWLAKQPPSAFYDEIVRLANAGHPIRVGRIGDCTNTARTEAIIHALLDTNIPFMWPTRAWREPSHPSWQLIDHLLPGKVICSLDPWLLTSPERPPADYPVNYIAPPPYFDPEPLRAAGYEPTPCPHYPFPWIPLYERASINCLQCGLCYVPVRESKPTTLSNLSRLPNVVFALHTARGKKRAPKRVEREPWHFRTAYERGETLEDVTDPYCGVLTPEGWEAPYDDA